MTGAWNGEHLLEALRAAAHDLERHAASLNALNVFPVPDGDTGTNMALNFQAGIDQNVQMMEAAADRVQVITFDVHQDGDRHTSAEAPQEAYNVCHALRQHGADAAEIATLYYSWGAMLPGLKCWRKRFAPLSPRCMSKYTLAGNPATA